MHVAIIRRSYRLDGGAEVAVNNFARAYNEVGVKVTLITESWEKRSPLDFQVIAISPRGSRLDRLRDFDQKVAEVISRNHFSVVQSHEWIPLGSTIRVGDGLHSFWISRLKLRRSGVQALWLGFSRFHQYKLTMEARTLLDPKLRKIIVNSRYVEHQITQRYPNIDVDFELIRNVVPDAFYVGDVTSNDSTNGFRHQNLLFVGSGWERKGLMTALQLVAKLGADVSLTIIGQDKCRPIYERAVKRLGIASQIIFRGVKQMDQRSYELFDALILPTLYDPFPNVACEALVSGIPVFCSSDCGVVDYFDHDGVYVCDSLDDYVRGLQRPLQYPNAEFFRGEFSMERLHKSVKKIVL